MIRIIGIDPGTTKIGFGIIDFEEKTKDISFQKFKAGEQKIQGKMP